MSQQSSLNPHMFWVVVVVFYTMMHLSSSVPLISINDPTQVYIFGKLCFFLFHLIPNLSEYGQVESR